jgi:hypothetical protein
MILVYCSDRILAFFSLSEAEAYSENWNKHHPNELSKLFRNTDGEGNTFFAIDLGRGKARVA